MLKNIIVCAPKNYESFSKLSFSSFSRLYKQIVGRRKYGVISITSDIYCPNDVAYFFDSRGTMHTLIIEK